MSAPAIHTLSQTKGGRVHAYLLETSAGLILIDTLFDDDAKVIEKKLASLGKTFADIEYTLYTHSHKSHLGGGQRVASGGCFNLASENDIPIIEGEVKASPVGKTYPWRYGLQSLEVYGLQTALNHGIGSHRPIPIHGRIWDGVYIGPLEVVATPGHTPGSLSFWWPEMKALFTGDAVATWPRFDIGWYTFNLDPAEAKRSIHKMIDLNPSFLGCGHGGPILTDAGEKLKELINGKV